ncbi:mtor-associated protein meak7 [Anaeramoeba flamelloides]|uniref:Mtor-associated protein meak7 n=1 Tax=Anaeramoeba flamelloides TaxID=1746091 RepID=A0AAV7Y7U7_9EUKA|nr:mtor-associated protein meak7 [Anaeramoeba flamelloides]
MSFFGKKKKKKKKQEIPYQGPVEAVHFVEEIPTQQNQQNQQNHERHLCDQCLDDGKKKQATFFCQNCELYYCDKHERFVHKISDLQKHIRTRINTAVNNNIEEDWNLVENKRKLSEKTKKKVIKERRALIKEIQNEIKSLEQDQLYLVEHTNKQYGLLRNALQNKMEALQNSIVNEHEKKIKKLKKQYSEISQSIEELTITNINEVIVSENTELLDHLNQIFQNPCPKPVFYKGFEKTLPIGNQMKLINELDFVTAISLSKSSVEVTKCFSIAERGEIKVKLKNDKNEKIFIKNPQIKFQITDSSKKAIKLDNLNWISNGGDAYEAHFSLKHADKFQTQVLIENVVFSPQEIHVYLPGFSNPSKILTHDQYIQITSKIEKKIQFKLNFDYHRDKKSFKEWQKSCHLKGSSLTIVKNIHGYIFGGYSDVGWGPSNSWKTSNNSFLFYCGKSKNGTPKILNLSGKKNNYAIWWYESWGPTFGNGRQFSLNQQFKSIYNSECDVYQNPKNGAQEFQGANSNHLTAITHFECFCERI